MTISTPTARPLPKRPAPLPVPDKTKLKRYTPEEAHQLVMSRTYDESKIYNGGKLTPHTMNGKFVPKTDSGNASNTVEGPASITELVRALQNNPQYIFEWVYNNIDWEPGWGLSCGAFGTILAGRGNAFDQSCLLVTLLEAAGYTASYVLGTIQLNAAAGGAWFGTDPTNIDASDSYCFYNEIPVAYVYNSGEGAYDIQMSHVWVECVIGTTTYLFDPSYKTYTRKAPVANLGTILGYNSSTFLSSAESGATIDPSGNFVKSLNDTNVRANLATYAGNLATWIEANNPTAQISDILGGAAIVPVTLPVLNTTLPYIVSGATQTVWTGASGIPLAYKNTFELSWSDADITQTFTADQLAGLRLSIFWSGTTPTLSLNGTSVEVGSAVAYTLTYPAFTVTHNAYTNFPYNQSDFLILTTGEPAIIGTSFCNQGRGAVDYHQNQLNINVAAGDAASSEPVLGETLALIWNTYLSESCMVQDLLGRLNHAQSAIYQAVALVGYVNSSPTIDNPVFFTGGVGLDSAAPSTTNRVYGGPFGLMTNSLERGCLQQVTGNIPSLNTGEVLRIANNAGTTIYQGTSANWSATVEPVLTANGYTSAQISDMYDNWVNNGFEIEVPAVPETTVGTFVGYGYYTWPTGNNGGPGGQLDYASGGAGGVNQTPGQMNGNGSNNQQNPTNTQPPGTVTNEPIDMFTGNYTYSRRDISVGSQPFPYGLEFTRNYNSRNRYTNGPLGLGWTHNYNISATINTDGFLALGQQSALPAVATIAAMWAMMDICTTTTLTQLPVANHVIGALCSSWWIDQITQNTVVIQMPEGVQVFALLPNGTYAPPLGSANKLTLTAGLYTVTTPQGVKMTFNASGQLTGWIYPSGATVTLNYTSGVLTSITVLGRTLTLTYTSGLITAVTDGTRTIHYGYDASNDLTSFTDADTRVYTYYYDQPGRMTKFYKPQNPTTAFMTNVYDTLSRVKTQSDALGHLWTYYFAASRSEEVDPLSNARVRYFNQNGSLIRDINALLFETNYLYDGLNRQTQMTLPEGNMIKSTYDANNNILTKTWVPKVGSGLSNVVNTYTYDPTWAKVKTFKDGNLNTTTYNYDPTLGNLLTVQKPAIGGVTPTITNAYNARGQVTSVKDETGIQTQNTYDTATEKLTKSVLNTNWLATIGGTVTVGNVLTLTAHDALLTGGLEAVTYTVKTGDTLTTIAAGLAAAVNADTKLAAVGIIAYSSLSVISLSTAKGNTTTFTESTSGGSTETITVAAGLNLTTNYGYDAAGNNNSIQDPNANTTASVYDNERRLTQITLPSPFSYVTNITYDFNGNRLTVQKQTGNMTNPYQIFTWTYSVTDKKKTLVDPSTYTTTWNYDGKDRLENVIDPMSREYQYAYDALDRLYQTTDPTSTISGTSLYTNNGFLKSIEDARSETTQYSYDGLDRLNETIYADTSYQQNQSYDANGNVLTYRTRSGSTIINTYDVLNRISTKAPASQPTVTYGYDLAGRLESASKPVVSGDPSSGNFQKFYDTAGRFDQEEYPDSKLVTFVLDSNGNITKITYPDGYYVTRKYDQLNRLTNIYLNGSTTAAATFAYDELSRRTTLTYSNGAIVTYGYQSSIVDDLTSIAQAFVGSSVTFTYGYNHDHEIDSQAVTDNTYMWYPSAAATVTYGTANSVNEYPTVGGATYSYNGDACLSGNGTWTYTYDTENHLTAASETGTSVSYVYDGLHRQAQKTVGTTETRYIYSGWQRIADYNGSTGALENRYVYGIGLDEPLIQVTSAGVLTFYHANHQGSIIGVSNSSGAIANKNVYGPFGETTLSGTTFGFTGQRYDSESNLYYYKYRVYSPSIGRFLQPDPMQYLNGLNLYTYVKDAPLDRDDLKGLSASPVNANSLASSVANSDMFDDIGAAITVSPGFPWNLIPASCLGGCTDGCTNGCTDACTGTCTGQCSWFCSNTCTDTCTNACSNDCSQGCGGTDNCTGGCTDLCTNGCTNICTTTGQK
jgi:RHS repeat-associated protein